MITFALSLLLLWLLAIRLICFVRKGLQGDKENKANAAPVTPADGAQAEYDMEEDEDEAGSAPAANSTPSQEQVMSGTSAPAPADHLAEQETQHAPQDASEAISDQLESPSKRQKLE